MLAFTATSSWYNFIEHSLRPQEFGRRTPTTDNFAVANISTFVGTQPVVWRGGLWWWLFAVVVCDCGWLLIMVVAVVCL